MQSMEDAEGRRGARCGFDFGNMCVFETKKKGQREEEEELVMQTSVAAVVVTWKEEDPAYAVVGSLQREELPRPGSPTPRKSLSFSPSGSFSLDQIMSLHLALAFFLLALLLMAVYYMRRRLQTRPIAAWPTPTSNLGERVRSVPAL